MIEALIKDIWVPPIGGVLHCQRKRFNPSDPFIMAMLHDGVVVGYFSCLFSIYKNNKNCKFKNGSRD